MLALTRPKFFVPVHGEHRMLVQHSRTGHAMGVPVDNTLIIDNGDVVELTPDSIRKGNAVKAGIELLDQSRNGIVDARVLKERQQLAEDGVVTILAAISTDGAMVAPPRVNLRGVVTTADARKMSLWVEREIKWVLENRWKQLCRNTGGKAPEVDWMGVQREVEVGLGRRMRRELQVEPLILCLVQPAPGGTPVYKGRADAEPDDRPGSPRSRWSWRWLSLWPSQRRWRWHSRSSAEQPGQRPVWLGNPSPCACCVGNRSGGESGSSTGG